MARPREAVAGTAVSLTQCPRVTAAPFSVVMKRWTAIRVLRRDARVVALIATS
jgi:hypothetical protein